MNVKFLSERISFDRVGFQTWTRSWTGSCRSVAHSLARTHFVSCSHTQTMPLNVTGSYIVKPLVVSNRFKGTCREEMAVC